MIHDVKARLIAFYLPHFHASPENDEWWGEGFTEWTNVRATRPVFKSHHQPRKPGELGYYNLLDSGVRAKQADMARKFGVDGFCYYHYWFNGKQMLEKPFNEVLGSGEPDFPFCLCWANENWTRAWDGLDREILIAQDYSNYNVEEHVDHLSPAFRDPRYILVDGRPLYLIYRADQIPGLAEVIKRIRARAISNGIEKLYICAVRNTQFSLSYHETIASGFDAVIDFQPNSNQLEQYVLGTKDYLNKIWGKCLSFFGHPSASAFQRLDYERFTEAVMSSANASQNFFPCVFPSWDNSARRSQGATIIQNDDPQVFGRFLRHAINQVSARAKPERLVFINAWNEWAEGCYLEPDQRNALSFLEEIKSCLEFPNTR